MAHHSDAALVTRYSLGGLVVDSDIPLPELLPGPASAPDVTVRWCQELPSVPDLVDLWDGWWVAPTAILFEIPYAGRFLVRDGCQIMIAPLPGCDPATIRLFLLGSAFGALFHQRGLLPLHAGGVVAAYGCCAFGGDSGAGKSTLGAFLRRRGYRSLADDVLVVEPGGGRPRVLPGYPQTKLWADTAAVLGLDTAGRGRVGDSRDKYYVEIDRASSFCADAQPFSRFYVLTESDTAPSITRLGNAEAMAELTRNTYRPFLLEPMGRWAAHFAACAELVHHVGVYRLARRRDFGEMAAVVDLLEAHFNDPGV